MSITINLDKAKDIAHEKRRQKRSELFAPHDAVISKQIPGTDSTVAENARSQIRANDAVVQQNINAAANVNDLKTVLQNYQAI